MTTPNAAEDYAAVCRLAEQLTLVTEGPLDMLSRMQRERQVSFAQFASWQPNPLSFVIIPGHKNRNARAIDIVGQLSVPQNKCLQAQQAAYQLDKRWMSSELNGVTATLSLISTFPRMFWTQMKLAGVVSAAFRALRGVQTAQTRRQLAMDMLMEHFQTGAGPRLPERSGMRYEYSAVALSNMNRAQFRTFTNDALHSAVHSSSRLVWCVTRTMQALLPDELASMVARLACTNTCSQLSVALKYLGRGYDDAFVSQAIRVCIECACFNTFGIGDIFQDFVSSVRQRLFVTTALSANIRRLERIAKKRSIETQEQVVPIFSTLFLCDTQMCAQMRRYGAANGLKVRVVRELGHGMALDVALFSDIVCLNAFNVDQVPGGIRFRNVIFCHPTASVSAVALTRIAARVWFVCQLHPHVISWHNANPLVQLGHRLTHLAFPTLRQLPQVAYVYND